MCKHCFNLYILPEDREPYVGLLILEGEAMGVPEEQISRICRDFLICGTPGHLSPSIRRLAFDRGVVHDARS